MNRPAPFSRMRSPQFVETVIGPAMFGHARRRVVICFFGVNTFRPISTIETPDGIAAPLELNPVDAEIACRAANDLWADFLMSRRFGGRTPA